MKKKVIIYGLIDPFTLKIRYIGRTSVSLSSRLSQHVHRAKRNRDKTHKEKWIRSILKFNAKPYIKKIIKVDGWEESYELEKCLINRYSLRLLNHNDRGIGGINKVVTKEQKKAISESLKKHYKTAPNPARKIVYCYNEDGAFYKEYISIRQAAKDLNRYFKVISKQLNNNKPPIRLKLGKQFSFTKVDKMIDYTDKKNN